MALHKYIAAAIWVAALVFTSWLIVQPTFGWDIVEELFWFAATASLIAYSAHDIKHSLLLYTWLLYCLGLLLDLIDDFFSSQVIPILMIDTSLKNIGFFLTCIVLFTVIRDERKTVIRLNIEIKQREELEQKLRHEANHDPLTGIGNRKACFEHFSSLSHLNSCILYFDLDNFKQANDKHGHITGDKILKNFAHSLTQQFGSENSFRLGGDEFVAFAQTPPADIEQLRALLLQEVFEFGIGLSIGISPTDTNTSPDSVLHTADLSMYRDKANKKLRSKIRDN